MVRGGGDKGFEGRRDDVPEVFEGGDGVGGGADEAVGKGGVGEKVVVLVDGVGEGVEEQADLGGLEPEGDGFGHGESPGGTGKYTMGSAAPRASGAARTGQGFAVLAWARFTSAMAA